MTVDFIFQWQFGLMISVGNNYEKVKYMTIEIPFLILLFSFKRKNK